VKILAFGDIHEDIKSIKKILGSISADLIIITGDLTNFGGVHEAKKVIDNIKVYNSNILALLGNLDKLEIDDYLSSLNINLNGNGYKLGGSVGIFGVGGSNPTPMNTPTEYSEECLALLAAQGFEKIKDLQNKIMISHAPPFNTKTDIISSGLHVGSKAIRNFIENNKPDLCICGHIHESRAKDKIGATLLINPGMISRGYVLINIDEDKINADLVSLK
jgi:uncharacterized protein